MTQNALALALEDKKTRGIRLLDLTESNPTKCGFRTPPLAPFSDPANLLYEPDPRGLLSAREAVCGYYAAQKIAVNPENVFLTSSTSEAYSFLFRALCEAGDEVLYEPPGYPLFEHLADFARVRLSPQVSQKTRAAVVVNPNNPTGRYVPMKEWDRLGALCQKQGMAVISDEVFFDFNWRGGESLSAASRADGLHFTLNGISKMLGLPQMKLAWIVLSGPDDECRAAAARLELIADTFLSVNTPSQRALSQWMAGKDAFVEEVLRRVKRNFQVLRAAFPAVEEPEGGWYALLPLPKGVTDEDFVLRVLEQQDTLIHPGYFFDFKEECAVISLLPRLEEFSEGARRVGLELN